MKLILFISLFFSLNCFSEAIEIINPYNQKTYPTYMYQEMLKEILLAKTNGEINSNLSEILSTINDANPDAVVNSERFAIHLLNASSAIQFSTNYNVRSNVINYLQENMPDAIADPWKHNRIKQKITQLEIGRDFSLIPNLSQDDRQEYLFQVQATLSHEDKIKLLESSILTSDEKTELRADLVSEIINGSDNAESIKSYLNSNPTNMHELACNYIRATIYNITEEDDSGTLSRIRDAKNEDYFEEYMQEDYLRNVETLKGVYNTFEQLGVNSNAYCEDGKTLKELVSEDEYFDFNDISNSVSEVPEVNEPCLSTIDKNILSNCNVADIIWMIENLERKENKMLPKVKYINSRGFGNCNVTLISERKETKLSTFLRISNQNGSEREITGSPKTLIHLLMK